MMNTGRISVLLFLLLPLCTLIIGTSVKTNSLGLYDKILNINQGNGCPPERYYIESQRGKCLRKCEMNSHCTDGKICCPDNCDTTCKPPAKNKMGSCPVFEATLASTARCSDKCSSDSECDGSNKCCIKGCGKTCTATLNDIGKPSTVSTASTGFCPQELLLNCILEDKATCDAASCLEGYKCCPKLCRWECQKPLAEKAGKCPKQCPPEKESKACSSDYDCSPLFKCCATCGNTCVKAVNIPTFLHNGTTIIYMNEEGR